ncbi:MAG: acetylxylan esterase, partial [Bacteroidota bacterium]|nr:acetylxylan esterase [Bacteroidota bacterium]
MKNFTLLLLFSFLLSGYANAQRENVNYEESKISEYKLPDVLTRFNGRKVKSEKVWFKKQRPEILELFTKEVYGKVPGELGISEVKIWESSDNALNGLAYRKQLSLFFNKNEHHLEVNVLMYLP